MRPEEIDEVTEAYIRAAEAAERFNVAERKIIARRYVDQEAVEEKHAEVMARTKMASIDDVLAAFAQSDPVDDVVPITEWDEAE